MLNTFHLIPLNMVIFVFLSGSVLLDLLFGDPRDWPHPVRLLGRALNFSENWARHCPLGPTLGGGIVVIGLAGISYYLVGTLTHLPLVGELLALYLGYAGLAWGCLLRETNTVLSLLEKNQLQAARIHLAGLVSRDTSKMDQNDVYRSLAETLSENFNDGFVAPLFWLALGGPAALWVYKAISTVDSMWGYRTESFEQVGKIGARLDDILAWIPARLSAFSIWVVAWILLRPISWQRVMHEARTMDSPNAGWPMSAGAHLARAGMGGPTQYQSQIKDKPRLGPDAPWTGTSIRTLRQALKLAAILAAASLIILGSWLSWWTLG